MVIFCVNYGYVMLNDIFEFNQTSLDVFLDELD